VEKGYVGCVEALLELGAPPRVLDYSGSSPLYEAITREDEEIATLLLAYGRSDVLLQINNEGDTPFLKVRSYKICGKEEMQSKE
jgi:ankyrin repeat protein